MEKSPDAFRTISEVADWLDVPTHVLRFWESRFSQVRPVKRAGGRRYYRPADMRLIGGIKRLLHDDGMTIRGVQKLLREEGVKHVCGFSQPLEHEAAGTIELPASRRSAPDIEIVAEPEPAPSPAAPSPAPEEEAATVVEFTSAPRDVDPLDEAPIPPEADAPAATAPEPDLVAATPAEPEVAAPAQAASFPDAPAMEPELPLDGGPDEDALTPLDLEPFLSDAPDMDPQDDAPEHAHGPGIVSRLTAMDPKALARNKVKLEQVVAALRTIRTRG